MVIFNIKRCQSDVPVLRLCIERQSTDAGEIPVRRLWVRKSRRCNRRDQCVRVGIPLVCLWSVGAIRSLDESGTHRSGSANYRVAPQKFPYFTEGRVSAMYRNIMSLNGIQAI